MHNAIRLIAENRIEDAIADGLFEGLPKFGEIDCSVSGERFFAEWFAKRLPQGDARAGTQTVSGRCADGADGRHVDGSLKQA
jgi:hypothetical protein